MGERKIDIKPNAKPIKKRPYKLAHKYKEIVKIGDHWNEQQTIEIVNLLK